MSKLATCPLSDDFATINLTDSEGRPFTLVSDRAPSPYEAWLQRQNPYGPIAQLARLALGGSGTLIDVGANIGTISVPVAQDGNWVLAIEMLPLNCLKLMLAQNLNNLPNMIIFQGAATDAECIINYVGGGAFAAIGGDPAGNQAAGYRLDLIAS